MSGYSESGARNRLHMLFVDGAGTVHSAALDCDDINFGLILETLARTNLSGRPRVCPLCKGKGMVKNNVGCFNNEESLCRICRGRGIV